MPVSKECLPYPIVYYPLGAFIAFKQSEEAEYVFCSCMQEAIENYIRLRQYKVEVELRVNKNSYLSFKELNPETSYILSGADFPPNFIKYLIRNNAPEDDKIINYLIFRDRLCHKCNKATPEPAFCHEMYGGKFKQKFGWYILENYYGSGVYPYSFFFKKELVSNDLLPFLQFDYMQLFSDVKEQKALAKYSDRKIKSILRKLDSLYVEGTPKIISSNTFEHIWAYEINKVIQKRQRQVNKIIENEVRLRFDHKKIGEAWTSETILYSIVKRLFPNKTIIRHYRPRVLDNLELDIYIDEYRLGIEYQGIQHFEPIKHWGGENALKQTQERDKRKKQLCDCNGIKLIYFNYHQELSESVVKDTIKLHLL